VGTYQDASRDITSNTMPQEHAYYYQTGQTRTYQEMRQKPVPRETFFNLKHEPRSLRPESVATEFVDTDWDEDDIISEPEDNSPRLSLQSVCSSPEIPMNVCLS
jgi:hypothetical protein